jgi:SAM-dependent methyltransferase
MLERAAEKGLPVMIGDASDLPVADGSVDAVLLISMLHHVPDADGALAEARRVVRPGGTMALMAFAREHLAVHWVMRYFPTAAAHFVPAHQPLAQLQAGLPGAMVTPLFYEDTVDGSMAALCRQPALLLDPDIRRQTSFFEKAAELSADELAAGTKRLRADLAAGARPEDQDQARRARLGDASLLTWRRHPSP